MRSGKYLRSSIFFLHYLWFFPGAFAAFALFRILSKANEDRNSIAVNREILELVNSSTGLLAPAIIGMIVSLVVMRRKLKRGVIDRTGVQWKRVVLGIALPIFYPSFLMTDIERLAQIPRSQQISKETLRSMKTSHLSIAWPVLFLLFAQVASPLNNALLGVVYVTEGTSSISDPTRYALKWIQPEVFTNALDKYLQYIWLGSIGFCLLLIALSILSWNLINKHSRMARNALTSNV
jgi:hypothetical protein